MVRASQLPSSEERNLLFHINMKCNLRCEYCYHRHKDGNILDTNSEMSEENIQKVFKFLEYTKKINTVTFIGGEPLLSFPIIERTMRTFKDKFVYKFMSNNTCNPDKLIALIKELNLFDNVRFISSYDGLMQDKRGKDTEHIIFTNVKKLIENGIYTSFTTTLAADNVDTITENLMYIADKALSLGIKYIKLKRQCQHKLCWTEEKRNILRTKLPILAHLFIYYFYFKNLPIALPNKIQLPLSGQFDLFRNYRCMDSHTRHCIICGVDAKIYLCENFASNNSNPICDILDAEDYVDIIENPEFQENGYLYNPCSFSQTIDFEADELYEKARAKIESLRTRLLLVRNYQNAHSEAK